MVSVLSGCAKCGGAAVVDAGVDAGTRRSTDLRNALIQGYPEYRDTALLDSAVKITRTGRRYPGERFEKWREEAMKTFGKFVPFTGPVKMWVSYTPGNLIKRDVPGMLDALCHLIEKVGLVLDDCQVVDVRWITYPLDRKHPGVAVLIEQLNRVF